MLAALACTVSALHQPAMPRRAVLAGAAAALSQPIQAHAEQIIAPGFEASRVQGIGGGADMLSDDPPSVCPECEHDGSIKKLVSRTSFVLKGGGWYKDHYGLKGSGSSGGDSGGTSSDSSD